MSLLHKAILDFEGSEEQLASSNIGDMRPVGYASSILFQGIAHFYLHEEDAAIDRFDKTILVTTGVIKARALNAKAFLKLVNGDIEGAEPDLYSATKEAPGFPLARSNIGFVLLAKNNLKLARTYFLQNKNDTYLQKFSPRDVILARVSLAHISEMDPATEGRAIEEYAAVLHDLGKNEYSAMDVPDLRLAYLLNEISESVYMNGQYYALEMFALNCQCKADRLAGKLKSDSRAILLRASLRSRMQAIAKKVNPHWLSFRQKGWFSDLQNCGLSAATSHVAPSH